MPEALPLSMPDPMPELRPVPTRVPVAGPAGPVPLAMGDAAAVLAAALGCLQPAIDPVFLTLLTLASDVPLAEHGLIVGMTQAGAALGGLVVWRLGHRISRRVFPVAALLAALCSLLTAATDGLPALLALRGAYGAAMGMVFAHAMACCAARRPSMAYGAMFLLQLLLATLVSLTLPTLAEVRSPSAALAAMAVAPVLAAIALLLNSRLAGGDQDARAAVTSADQPAASSGPARIPPAAWALAGANLAVITATMLVWSFSGALAAAAGIGERMIGEAVALGSLAGAVTAIAVMRERILVPLPLTALAGGIMIASPLLATSAAGASGASPGAGYAFAAAIIALNIGSTALIVRCSGLATAASPDARFRTLVACTHSLGMIAGPVLGSILLAGMGTAGLFAGAGTILAGALAATVHARLHGAGRGALWAAGLPTGPVAKVRQSA